MNKMNYSQEILDRFWSKVKPPEKEEDCWEWTSSAQFFLHGKFIPAAHFAYEYFYGKLPIRKISRTCNNSKCINPDHFTSHEIIDICTVEYNKMNLPQDVVNRFWSKVIVTSNIPKNHYNLTEPCWEWIGADNGKQGYGHFMLNRKFIRAHRISYEYFNGPIPDKLMICHKCDNPSCVNPEHLYPGTSKDNQNDCVKSNRKQDVKGSKHGMATTDEDTIIEILSKVFYGQITNVSEIENRYKITRDVIYQITTRQSWTHVTKDISNEDLKKIRNIINERYKFSEIDIKDIKNRISLKQSDASIAKLYNVGSETIRNIRLNKTKHYKNM
jgi:hypothetical protein